MKQRMVKLFAAMLSMLALTLASTAFAGPATDMVKAKQTTLFDLLKQSTPEAQRKIDAVFDEMLDYSSLAEASLGTEWAARSDAEKAEMKDRVARTLFGLSDTDSVTEARRTLHDTLVDPAIALVGLTFRSDEVFPPQIRSLNGVGRFEQRGRAIIEPQDEIAAPRTGRSVA